MTMIQLPDIDPMMIANNLTSPEPTHPGEVLREEIEYRGITQTALAERVGLAVSLINELINGKRDFTTEYALLIEAALGISADFWLNMQTAYNKSRVSRDSAFMRRLDRIRRFAAAL